MTEKQIIIDGVDVSKCEHLYKEIDCLAHIDFSECCEGYNPSYGYCPNTDCYYKQLARKEQECEELEYDYYNQLKNTNKWIVECKNLQQQLDQLKAEFDKKELIFAGVETSNRLLIEKIENIKKQKEKLKQTLAEIKEIAEKQVKRSPDGETFARPEIKQILQKIDEVENE